MNFLKKVTRPSKRRSCVIDWRTLESAMALALSGIGFMPSPSISIQSNPQLAVGFTTPQFLTDSGISFEQGQSLNLCE